MNHLYYGDNLTVLRESIPTESVDLIYLDPPFNSNASYNQLFKAPDGTSSAAQIEAFNDTWHWNVSAESAYGDVLRSDNAGAADMLRAMRGFLGDNDMMAYLAMMAVRLLELHRVLKPTGSLYLHCDPTASHYLKILLDAVFGARNFRNEIVWDYSFRLMDLPNFFNRKHDVILFYAKTKSSYFKMPKTEWTKSDLVASRKQKIHIDEHGVEWIWMPGGKGNSKNKLRRVDEIISEGKAISDVWSIPIISSSSKERLGYPTQKPVALLERILNASSNPGDVVLDPFCGCGTTVHAAQTLGRRWIGIDVTHLAIGLIEKRLRNAYRDRPEDLEFITHGTPQDLQGAQDLAQRGRTNSNYYFEFEKWALSLLDAQPGNLGKKGADGGFDGTLPFGHKNQGLALVSVKAGANVGVDMVRSLDSVVNRKSASIGVLLTLTPPTKPMVAAAAAAGQFTLEGFTPVPKLQIVTIEEAMKLRDRAVRLPARRDDTFKKAAKETDRTAQGRLDL